MAAFLSLNNGSKSLFLREIFLFDALSPSREDVCMTSLFQIQISAGHFISRGTPKCYQ